MNVADVIARLVHQSKYGSTAQPPFSLGIKMGPMRTLGRELANVEIDWSAFEPSLHYELNLIRGMIVAYSKLPLQEKWSFFEQYFTYATDWSYVDCVVVSLPKLLNREEVAVHARQYALSPYPYLRRFAYVLTLRYLINKRFLPGILSLINPEEPEYHVYMSIAWLLAEIYIKDRDTFVLTMKTMPLARHIRAKTVSKIRDSYRVSPSDKQTALKYKEPLS